MKNSLGVFEQRLLLFSVFIVALCGITYELVLGSLATYLLGNPVQQYSITIGFFLVSMGIGSYLSRFFVDKLLKTFILIEVALGIAGGMSVIVLNYLFSFSISYYMLHVFFLIAIGLLVGLEIPLLTRILKGYGALKDVISNVLSLDYLGGLGGSLLFPLVLFPYAGRLLTSLTVGALNIAVAIALIAFIRYPERKRSDYVFPVVALLAVLAIAFSSDQLNHFLKKRLFFDDIVFSRRSQYQEIVLTRTGDDFRLYLDGSLQFSTFDEYRYHEMLVYPALMLHPGSEKKVLVMGGGDGLAVRDVLKCNGVKSVTLVELDPLMISLARNNPSFKRINRDSLNDSRVRVIIGDAFMYLRKTSETYDVIIADFPDPHDESISKLYSVELFRMVKRTLRGNGVFITQSTSPLFARDAFWCIHNTMGQVFSRVTAYHVYVPTFGDWGFNIAMLRKGKFEMPERRDIDFRFFSPATFASSLYFPRDSRKRLTKINTFDRPVLYTYYLNAWRYMDY